MDQTPPALDHNGPASTVSERADMEAGLLEATFSCLALTDGLCQVIADPGVVAIGTSVKTAVGALCRSDPHGLLELFLRDDMFWDERGGGLTRQPVDPIVDAATVTTAMGTNRVDSKRFSSQCCAFRCRHTRADPIRLLCIRQASSA